MMPFHYRRISQAFIQELYEKVLGRESIVLLSPRYGGKRYTMARLHTLLQETGVMPLVPMKLLRETPVATEQQAVELIAQAVADTGLHSGCTQHASDDLLAPLDQLSSQAGKPVVLLVANVDGMAYHLARCFLEGVRTRVESGQLIAILSGEDDFRDLVHGPKSEFNCANQFVLQGFAEDEFNHFVGVYTHSFHLEFESPEEAYAYLWKLTGGSTYLLRQLIWAVVESRARSNDSTGAPVKLSDIVSSIKTRGIPGAYGAHVLRHTTQLIDREPGCWSDLDNLIQGKTVQVRGLEGSPTPLELSGVAFRKGSQLQFSSPLMQEFIEQHYHNRRFADLYATAGQWPEAFERYGLLNSKERLRPLGVEDRADIESVVSAFNAKLYLSVTKGVQEVKQLFAQGCRYLLGFCEITFWQRNAKWHLEPLANFSACEESRDEVEQLLPLGEAVSAGLLPLPEPWNKYALAALLPALRSNQQGAVIVSHLARKTIISRERERLANDLLQHFVTAYSQAIEVERDRARLRVRNQHVEIMNSIFEALGSRVLDAGHALTMASLGLRKLGYRRVLFCLVDPMGKRIQGVRDDSDDPSVDVAAMTDWSLDEPMADLQPYVIHTKASRIIRDASLEPLTNKSVIKCARLKAFAIVPILNPSGDAIGTIHVEREDTAIPSRDEVENLEAFGRQFAIAIEQSERVNLLQSALDKIPEPVVIVDRMQRERYANKPAAKLFGLHTGWRVWKQGKTSSAKGLEEVQPSLHDSLTSGNRLVRRIKGLNNDPEYRGTVLCDIIQDWRKEAVGALLHIQELSYLYRVFEAFRLIAEAHDTQSAMRSMLDATKLLGHKKGRLYIVSKNNPDQLVSKFSFGFPEQSKEDVFNNGKVTLSPRHDPRSTAWWCIEQQTPLVFCWKENVSDGDEYITPHGLRAINVNPPRIQEEVAKSPGDFWIDFPFITREKPLGKLALQCDEWFRPEDFELMKILSEGLFDAFLRQENELNKRERWIRQAAEQSMAITAHNIATRLSALPVILTRYRNREKEFPSLKELNEEFLHISEEILNTIQRTKERLVAPIPRCSTWILSALIERALKALLPDEDAWTFQCEQKSIEIWADSHLLEDILFELVQNSKEATTDHEHMHISVTIESIQCDGEDWVRIVYEDNGPGVPNDLKGQIFENFFSRRPERQRGTGLGLSFVRRVVEGHRGTIGEQGHPGQGVKFVIEIPRDVAVEEATEVTHVSYLDC